MEGTDFYLHHEDYDQDNANSVNTAISWHAKDALPDGALTAVVEFADGLPVIVGASESRLYVIDIAEIESEGNSGAQTRVRNAEWEIELPEMRVSIPGRSYANGEADEKEQLGQRIAEGPGMGDAGLSLTAGLRFLERREAGPAPRRGSD